MKRLKTLIKEYNTEIESMVIDEVKLARLAELVIKARELGIKIMQIHEQYTIDMEKKIK